MKTKTLLAWIGIFLLGFSPIYFLLAFGPKDYSSVTFTLGQIFGLVGMTMFALTFILSTRFKWIENLFDGLDKVYRVHSVIGATSFILLLMHPIFLVLKFIPNNFYLAAKYLLPGGLLSVDFGIFALIGMTLLLVFTFYIKFKYHYWKFSHEFFGLIFILAVLHITLVRGDVSRDYIFSGYYIYVAIISIIGIGGFVFSLLRKYIYGKLYTISKISNVNNCQEIFLTPTGKPISYHAGQFIFVKFDNLETGKESHPFSIAAQSSNIDAKSNAIRIITKGLGDYTVKMNALKVGNVAIVEGPYGKFHQDYSTSQNGKKEVIFNNEVWVAGGVGITPFLGLAKDFAALNKNSKSGKVDLFFSVKSEDEFIRLQELQKIAAENGKFRVFPWVSNNQGYLNIDSIEKAIKPSTLTSREYYICGPESLKVSIRNGLVAKGVSNNKIYDERFSFK